MSKWNKSSDAQASDTTVRAVVKRAAQLREQAARHADMGERDLYSPSDNAARILCTRLGPQEALDELNRRALIRELQVHEDRQMAARGQARLLTHQQAAAVVRDRRAATLTLGQRLDEALRSLDVLSETSAVRLDSEPVKSSKPESAAVPMRRQRERDALAEDAQRIVVALERELEWSRRRPVEKEEAAA